MRKVMKEKGRMRKIFSVILNMLVYLFFALCIVALFISINAKKDTDGAVNVFGMQMRIVLSPSMEKSEQTDVSGYPIKDIPVKSVVFIQTVPKDASKAEKWYADLKVGDVLTFKYAYIRQEVITHRIVEITEKPSGGYIIKLEGDNKSSNSDTMKQVIDTSEIDSFNYVIGKVVGVSHFFYFLLTVVRNPIGIFCIIIIPCLIIIILEIVKIIDVFQGNKKKKEQAKQIEKDEEIEALKQKVAELEQMQKMSTGNSDTSFNRRN